LRTCDQEASRSAAYGGRRKPSHERRALPRSQRQWKRRPCDSKAATRRDGPGDSRGSSAGIPECKALIAAGAYRHVPETEVRLTRGEVPG
jgi:hypothetical protein